MNKALKIIGIVAVVIVALIAGLTIFVRSYLTDARIRSFITETAESSLHRKVSLGPVSVSIFRGISAKDFEIKEKDSDSDFLKADAVVLKYRLLPLLSRRLIIDRLEIDSPMIAVKRKADGSFNFSDIMKQKNEVAPEKKGGASGLPVNLSVQSLQIEGGRLEYSDPDGKIRRALISLDAEMSIQGRSPQSLGSSGKAEMKILNLVLKDRQRAITDLPVSLAYNVELNLAEKKIMISDASVKGFGVPAAVKGAVNYGDPLSYAVEVEASSVNLADVQKAAAAFLPQGVGLSGVTSFKVAAEHKATEGAKTALSGEIRLEKAAVKTKSLSPVFDGTVVLTPEQISFRSMKLVAGNSSADISGRIADYSASPDIRLDVTSGMLDLDSIMPPSAKNEGAVADPAAAVKETKKEKESEPLKTKITAEGDVSISKMLYKGVTVEHLKAHYTFRKNVFTLAPLTGGTLSGSFRAESTVDLSRTDRPFSLKAVTDGISLENITAAFAPKAKGMLFGGLSADADISGASSSAEMIKRNLKGKGAFKVKNGRIKNAAVSNGLLQILGLQSLREIPMEKAEGTFSISGGVIDLKSIIVSKDLAMDETGTIGMDQKLNMAVLVKVSDRLSPNLLAQSGIAKFLSEEKGWTTIPLKLTGTMAKPSYSVDTQAIGRKAGQTIKRRVEEEIFKGLSGEKKKEEKPAGTEKKSSSPEDLLKEFFK